MIKLEKLLALVQSAKIEEIIQDYSEKDYIQSDIKRLDEKRDFDYVEIYHAIKALYGSIKPEKCLLRCATSYGEIYIYHFGFRYHIFFGLEKKKRTKKEDLYDSYRKKIINNYILKRFIQFSLGLIFIVTFIYLFLDNTTTYILISFLFLIGGFILLFNIEKYQLKKRNKDLSKLFFEYQEYLEREKIRKNHSCGELHMEWCSDPRFKFD